MTMRFDYEEYARKRPGLHCSNKYPSLYSDAIEGLSGTYADVDGSDFSGARMFRAVPCTTAWNG